MKSTRTIILASSTLAVLAVAGGIVGAVTTTGSGQVAQKDLGQSKVSKVLEPKQTSESRILNAAKLGTINETTKVKLLAKLAEIKAEEPAFQSSLSGKTRDEKLAAIDQKQQVIEAWEKANNVPSGYLTILSPFN